MLIPTEASESKRLRERSVRPFTTPMLARARNWWWIVRPQSKLTGEMEGKQCDMLFSKCNGVVAFELYILRLTWKAPVTLQPVGALSCKTPHDNAHYLQYTRPAITPRGAPETGLDDLAGAHAEEFLWGHALIFWWSKPMDLHPFTLSVAIACKGLLQARHLMPIGCHSLM